MVTRLPVDELGCVDPSSVSKMLTENTVLVSVMYANNEIGTVEPISEIAHVVAEFRETHRDGRQSSVAAAYPLLHTDATQAFQYLPCDVDELGVDMMTLSGHKIYGPKGIGTLYVRKIHNTYPLIPILSGGNQEFGLRAGTENIPAIIGFTKALELAVEKRESERERISELGVRFWDGLRTICEGVALNGALLGSDLRIPNIYNITFPRRRAEDLLIKLDAVGIAVSPGSACKARAIKESYVLKALGLSAERTRGSVRFSFGRPTTELDVDEALKRIEKVLQ